MHLVPDDGGIKCELAFSGTQIHIPKDVAQLLPVRQGACGGVTFIFTPSEVNADGHAFLAKAFFLPSRQPIAW